MTRLTDAAVYSTYIGQLNVLMPAASTVSRKYNLSKIPTRSVMGQGSVGTLDEAIMPSPSTRELHAMIILLLYEENCVFMSFTKLLQWIFETRKGLLKPCLCCT